MLKQWNNTFRRAVSSAYKGEGFEKVKNDNFEEKMNKITNGVQLSIIRTY
jgi:hypothetical protein